MFTAILLGNSFNRKMSIYNSLAVSAFLLLVVNPFNLWDVGFQLSYAALLSIAVLSKPITNLFTSTNIFLQTTWQLVAVTLAAQAFTLPLVIYHFHQFPLSFILANIIAVPLSSIILYLLIALLFLSFIPFVATITGWCCFYSIKAMNLFIGWVASLPFSRVDNINITIVQALLIFGLISFIAVAFFKRSPVAFVVSLAFLLVISFLHNLQWINNSRQSKMIVYNVPGKSAIDFIRGRKFYFLGNADLLEKSFLQNFHLLPSRTLHQVTAGPPISLLTSNFNEVHFLSKKILLIDKNPELLNTAPVNTDILIISSGCSMKPFELLRVISGKTIVLDGSVKHWRYTDWKNAADSLHLRLHSVQQQGAFVLGF